jgi:hypothetical protein
MSMATMTARTIKDAVRARRCDHRLAAMLVSS